MIELPQKVRTKNKAIVFKLEVSYAEGLINRAEKIENVKDVSADERFRRSSG